MKIGIDGRFWDESGVGRYIRNLVFELNKLDEKNDYVLLLNHESRIRNQDLNKNWKVVTTDIRWHTIEEQIKFPFLLYKHNLDLVHFPYFSIPLAYNKPFVVTIHDLILHHFPTGEASTHSSLVYSAKLKGYRYVISQAAKKAKHIIAVSQSTKKEIVDHLNIPANKVSVIYEGVDPLIKVSKDEKPLIQGDYILHIGNVYPHKNMKRFIEGFKNASIDRNTKLVLVGKPDHFMKALETYVSNQGIETRVIFYGFATDEELANLYSFAKAVAVPSLMEGFGLPALEAMAHGTLVLASQIPSLEEICQDNALYFDPTRIESISEVIEFGLQQDSLIKQKKKDGKIHASEFGWKKMADETLRIYEKSLSS